MGWKNMTAMFVLCLAVIVLRATAQNDYDIRVYTDIGLDCIIVIGLSLFMGYAGQVSLGHAGFAAIGAYSSGYLTTSLNYPPFATIAIGILITCVLAYILAVPSLKLRGHYLAMATLGFGFIVHSVLKNTIMTSDGVSGISGIPRLSIFSYSFSNISGIFYISWITVILLMVISLNIMRSRIGRACMAIHGNETAALAMGINTARLKTQMFILSAVFASLSGSYRAFTDPYLGPESFSVDASIHLVILVSVGGMTNLWTALSGAVFLSLLFVKLEDNWQFFKEYKILFDGGILMLIMMFCPKGLFISFGERIKTALRYWGLRTSKMQTEGTSK